MNKILLIFLLSSNILLADFFDFNKGKDIENSRLRALKISLEDCDTMKNRDKCAESLIAKYNKKHNLYSSINMGDFSSKYFKSNSSSSMDKILQLGAEEMQEAEKYSNKDKKSISEIVSISSEQVDIFSRQELSSKKIKRIFSRVSDSDILVVATLIQLAKTKIAILSLLLSKQKKDEK